MVISFYFIYVRTCFIYVYFVYGNLRIVSADKLTFTRPGKRNRGIGGKKIVRKI